MVRIAVNLYKVSILGDLDRERKVQFKMFELDHTVHGLGIFPLALKVAMNLRGGPEGFIRNPVKPLSESKLEELKTVIGK